MTVENAWMGGVVDSPFFFKDGSYRPALVMWATVCGGVVRYRLVPKRVAREELPLVLEQALAETTRRPDWLEVATDEDAALLEGVTGAPRVVVSESPLLDIAGRDLMYGHPAIGYPDTYFEPGIGRESVERFFAATQRMAATKLLIKGRPRVVEIDAPSAGLTRACVWLGNEWEAGRGFKAFDTFHQYVGFMRDRVHYESAKDWDDESRLEVHFRSEKWFERHKLAQIRRFEWPVQGPDSIPELDAHDHEGIRRPTLPTDLERASVIAEALAELLDVLKKRGRIAKPARKHTVVELDSTRHDVIVTCPHPELTRKALKLARAPKLDPLPRAG